MKNNFSPFKDRTERAEFIKQKFGSYFNHSYNILDIGCSNNDLKKITGEKVYGIDIAGTPDKVIDLEKERLSAFPDNSYDFLVCTEVLEHIDNLYEVLDDMVRVSKKYILISLPNCPDIWKVLEIVFLAKTGKFYGFPLNKPTDRHKWFFSWKELDKFFVHYARKNNLAVEEKFLHFNYFDSLKGKMLKIFLRIFPIKSFSNSYWVLLKK